MRARPILTPFADEATGPIELPTLTVEADQLPVPTTPQPAALASSSEPLLYGNWQPALFMPNKRSIGGIIAQVTIEENATDDLTITEHPVEQGAPIADHAYKRPATVTIRAGWSVAHSRDLSAETGVYGLLLSWQAALLPFDVVTGKRRYTNMLMERLTVITDEHNEYALVADMVLRQVIIVGTKTSDVQSASGDGSNHADPESTAPGSDKGDQPGRDVGDGGIIDPEPEQFGPEAPPGPPAPPTTAQTYQPSGGTGSGANPLGTAPEAMKVEGTVVGNAGTGQNLAEKGMTAVAIAPIPPGQVVAMPPKSLEQQRSERQQWQRMLRSRLPLAARSVSVSRYLASRTRSDLPGTGSPAAG